MQSNTLILDFHVPGKKKPNLLKKFSALLSLVNKALSMIWVSLDCNSFRWVQPVSILNQHKQPSLKMQSTSARTRTEGINMFITPLYVYRSFHTHDYGKTISDITTTTTWQGRWHRIRKMKHFSNSTFLQLLRSLPLSRKAFYLH